MFLIAGLGNVGDKYKNNRHNIGFMVIDAITKNLQCTKLNKSTFQAEVLKSDNLLFVKPTTFMNNSGVAIGAVSNYFDIPLEHIIVIHDDLDLPFGTIKFKKGGGHGGHNGLKSLDAHIGKDYIRVRIGIGKPEDKSQVVNYVLGDFSKEQFNQINEIMPHIIKSIEALQSLSIDEVKAKFSKKSQN